MTRTITRRLEKLEARVEVIARPPVNHVLCFIDTDHRVSGTQEMATGKWTEFDPPRDRAEVEPLH